MTFHHSPNSVFAHPTSFHTPDATKPPRNPPRKPARKPRKPTRKPRRKPRNPVPPVDNFPVDNSPVDNSPADTQLIIEQIKQSMMTMSSQIDALVHSLKRKREDSEAPPAKRSLVSQLGGLDIHSPIPLDDLTDDITDDTFFDIDFHLDTDLDAADLDAADLDAADLNEPGDPADLAAFLFKPVEHP